MKFEPARHEINSAVLDSKIHLDVPDVFPQKYIYHYTSAGGFQGILENGTLRFTNIRYMNDKSEVLAGLQRFCDIALRDMAEENRRNFTKFVLKADSIEEWWNNMQEYIFACCFSLSNDELSLWNYYTKDAANQGYSIGFEYKKLIESILKNNSQLENCKFHFGLVDYIGKQEDGYIEKSFTYVPNSLSAAGYEIMKGLLSKHEVAPEFETQKQQWIEEANLRQKEAEEKAAQSAVKTYGIYSGSTGEFMLGAWDSMFYFVKTGEYGVEKEIRLVVTIPASQKEKLKKWPDGMCHFRVSNGVLIPYIELKFDKEAISGIRLAPTITSDLAERSVRDFCEYCDVLPENLPEGIEKSKIPARF